MINDLISIVIPTYNGGKYIKDCLNSIRKQKVPFEIIVVDDISTDDTINIAKEMGAKIILNDSHKGQVASKNVGIDNMNGEYFVTIDQDDRFKPDALINLLKELKNSKANIVMAKLEDFAERDDDLEYCHKEPFCGILTGAAIFKKDVFHMIGFFDESVKTGEVIDLTYRCKKSDINIFYSDIITCERRIHHDNYGRNYQKEEYKDYAKILRKHFLERNK